MPHIEVIDYDQSDGELRTIYDELIRTRGKLADVHMIQSLNHKSIMNHMDLYMTIMFGNSPLKRYLREMIAVIVSVKNKCEYCQTHHGAALNHFWKDDERLAKLKEDFYTVGLNEQELLLCQYAAQLTEQPEQTESGGPVKALRAAGLSYRAILDATLVISYFNFVNRIVLSLGLAVEEDAGEGYEYD